MLRTALIAAACRVAGVAAHTRAPAASSSRSLSGARTFPLQLLPCWAAFPRGGTRPRSLMAGTVGPAAPEYADPELRLRHILVRTAAELDDAQELIEAGGDMEEVARSASACASAERGGDLGWLKLASLPAQVAQALAETPAGGLARATTGAGFHLLRVEGRREAVRVKALSVEGLRDLLADGDACRAQNAVFLDVREPGEFSTVKLPGFDLFPLSAVREWGNDIQDRVDLDARVVVLCHHGMRSRQAAEYLVAQGFKSVENVEGGIDLYARKIDCTLLRY